MSAIAVDIDDTLYSFSEAAREECLRRGHDAAAYVQWTDWRTPPDLLGVEEWVDVIKTVHADEAILSRQPYVNSQKVLAELAQKYHIRYITTRAPETKRATQVWLDKHNFPGGELIATWDDKQQYLYGTAALIDDRPKTCVQYLAKQYLVDLWADYPKVFMLQKPYNHNLTDVPGIFVSPTWAGFRKGLRKAGLLGD